MHWVNGKYINMYNANVCVSVNMCDRVLVMYACVDVCD